MREPMILSSLLLLAACGANAHEQGGASGQNGRRDFQIGGFDRVELAGSNNVIVTVGGAPSAYAEGDTGLLDRLEVKVENGVLRIGQKKGSWSFGWSKGHGAVTVHVTAPSLRGAEIAGSGDMRIDKVQADSFAASIAGSGELELGSLTAKSASFSIAGSGGVSASGRAESGDFEIAGSGDVRAGGFEVKRAKVSIAGSGNVEAKAIETADIAIMGSGDAIISGPAKCKVSKMGSGDARCGG
jgi:Putative auto-transporter adhesin, head GIN domain